MGRDGWFCSHAFTFFQYLVNSWRQSRLDEGVTEVLAATRLTRMENSPPHPGQEENGHVEEKKAETIDLHPAPAIQVDQLVLT
jgi:hypothetical protein